MSSGIKPEKIVHRDEIVRRQAEKVQQELADVTRKVNEKLKAATSLPVRFLQSEFGSERTRAELLNWLRDAGWKVVAVPGVLVNGQEASASAFEVQ